MRSINSLRQVSLPAVVDNFDDEINNDLNISNVYLSADTFFFFENCNRYIHGTVGGFVAVFHRIRWNQRNIGPGRIIRRVQEGGRSTGTEETAVIEVN